MKKIVSNLFLLGMLVGIVFAVIVLDLPRFFIIMGWCLALVYGLLAELRLDSNKKLAHLVKKYQKENSDLFVKLIEAEQQPTQLVVLQKPTDQLGLLGTKKKEKEQPN